MSRVSSRHGVALRKRLFSLRGESRAIVSAAAHTPHPHEQPLGPQSNRNPPISTHISSNVSRWPPPSTFALYKTSLPPTSAQLAYANRFFISSKPNFLSGSAKFRTLPASSVPEVAFLGRSNVGKSSILNALLQRSGLKIANVSKKPGRTKQMNAFGLGGVVWAGGERREDGARGTERWEGRGGLVILDMPGYGKASREEWGKEITKYLVGRKQLRRTFVLIDGEHGIKSSDVQLLDVLRGEGILHQVVLSKMDKLLFPRGKVTAEILEKNIGKMRTMLEETRGGITPQDRVRGNRPLDDVLTCSAETDLPPNSGNKLGIDNLRWAILSATGLDCDADGAVRQIQYDLEETDADGNWVAV